MDFLFQPEGLISFLSGKRERGGGEGGRGGGDGETPKLYFNWFLILITEIEDVYPSHIEIPSVYFPLAQADITECSTYAVVCRLKASPTYTITSKGGSFSHPDHPRVIVTIPENAVASNAKCPLELKVRVILYVRFIVTKLQSCVEAGI